ncbi:uncharacterized protein TrAFT101_000849 [Trichoderma asperellum]|uniref:Uncharacterized protein n=1 Tax=Trichoderma asperellum (strain ATCC 204424 / CBS 433.97 / NBRC 101777) TaxID=1042311 RepID=A0A2T3ZKS1_TRIA4|nr:hypothetical protein M441DRAFT_23611 [Trichoderma asperellum CBS 433.97]PTB45405.1 hypothetical protein M441DRAFT_23611 [Trichoderma asperellum CBS 433.97]UKZ84969.1 hypothetical protein TrAFT101_000849 [Trichoderma asperellum]
MEFDLFDQYGRLKLAFKKASARSGSVRIDKRYRRQGMGREMVHVILQKALAKCNPHAFVAIARSASEVRDRCKGESEEEEDAIYDRRGARRNASQCL